MSFDRLFEDYAWKAWDEDAKVYVGSEERLPLNIDCCLYYLDRSETNGGINWAAGTTNGITFEDGTPAVSWTAYDNGINLELDYVEGMSFTCENIVVLSSHPPVEETTEDYVEETTDLIFMDDTTVNLTMPNEEDPTEPPVEYPTEYPDIEETTYIWTNTEDTPVYSPTEPATEPNYDPWDSREETVPGEPAPDTVQPDREETRRDPDTDRDDANDPEQDQDKEDEIQEILKKYGCGAAAGVSSLTALLALAAAAFICRKKN
jgi:hypothetical protein